jgi:hypothetical protein
MSAGSALAVERIEALKANDPKRQRIGELFRTWWEHHASDIMKANDLAEPVKAIADPQGRGRQYLATFLSGLAGTRAAGFVLTRQEPAGKWTAATYALTEASPTNTTGHGTHRTDGVEVPSTSPMGPIPMPPPTTPCRQAKRRRYDRHFRAHLRCANEYDGAQAFAVTGP